MAYTLYTNGVLEKDGFYVPIDEFNPDYIAYKEWLLLGNTPASADGAVYCAKKRQECTDKDQTKAAYQVMITRLEQIEGAASPTNAQVIAAVRDLATYQKRIMQYLKAVL